MDEKRILIQVSVFILVFIVFYFVIYPAFNNHFLNFIYCRKRIEKCMNSSYIGNIPDSKFTKYPIEYYNPYFEKTMSYYIRDYYIPASYRSYAACNSEYDVSSLSAIKYCLDKGARFIHLDINFRGTNCNAEEIIPIITATPNYKEEEIGKCFTAPTLEEALKVINQTAWSRTNDPLFLYLEFQSTPNDYLYSAVGNLINNILYHHLLPSELGFSHTPIGDIEMTTAMNKVIILTNRVRTVAKFDAFVNGIILPPKQEKEAGSVQQLINVMAIPEVGENAVYEFVGYNENKQKQTINFNKQHLSYAFLDKEPPISILKNPKNEIENLDFNDIFPFGVQIVAMNYQKPDENLRKYCEYFQSGSLRLKEESLRYIPKPLPKISAQHPQLTFKSRRYVDERPGWADFKF